MIRGKLVTFTDTSGGVWTLPIDSLGLRMTPESPPAGAIYTCIDLQNKSYEFAFINEATYAMLHRALTLEFDTIPYTKFVT